MGMRQQDQDEIIKIINQFSVDTRMLIEKLRVSIPAYAEEFLLMNIGDTVDPILQYSNNIIKVTCIVVNTPTSSTSVTLQLGRRILPLPSGLVVLPELAFILPPSEKRQITVAPALTVPAFAWIMGEQMPEVNF
jgi:hypothetical protein